MFERTRIRLTATYLGIIMLLSLAFSVVVYNLSMNNLLYDFSKQRAFFQQQLDDEKAVGQILNDRSKQLDEERDRLFLHLLTMNGIIFVLGGIMSYLLAMRALAPIEKAHAVQARFTADASHELRTPLTVMQTENEVTLMNPKLTVAQAKQQIQSNLDEVARLTALSERLLYLAQSEKQPLKLALLPLEKVIDSAWDSTKRQAKKKQITLVKQPSINNKVTVVGDMTSAAEAIGNIFENAVKYCQEKATVTVDCFTHGQTILIKICDNGPGIKPESTQRIFDRFYREDDSRTNQTNKKKSGYGLGLSITKSLIELQRGTISVKSTLGEGTSFLITLQRQL